MFNPELTYHFQIRKKRLARLGAGPSNESNNGEAVQIPPNPQPQLQLPTSPPPSTLLPSPSKRHPPPSPLDMTPFKKGEWVCLFIKQIGTQF